MSPIVPTVVKAGAISIVVPTADGMQCVNRWREGVTNSDGQLDFFSRISRSLTFGLGKIKSTWKELQNRKVKD